MAFCPDCWNLAYKCSACQKRIREAIHNRPPATGQDKPLSYYETMCSWKACPTSGRRIIRSTKPFS